MSDIIITEIKVDERAIQAKLEALLDPATMTQIQSAFADVIARYTPFLTGKLMNTSIVTDKGITYIVPYAREKYYGEVYFKEIHPLATSHWDKVAMETQMPVLKERVLEILKQRAKELYG